MGKRRIGKYSGTVAMLGAAGILTVFSFACMPAAAQTPGPNQPMTKVYVAQLHSLNANITGRHTTGIARFVIQGDKLTISIRVHGASPDMTHWQHFHGFKDGRDATCPTQTADKNHDGIIDLIETEPTSGTTMVPFDENPAAMQIADGTYPKSSSDGTYHYRKVVSLKALEAGFRKAFPGQQLDLNRRVVMIHGVSSGTKLLSSVASLGPIPSNVTLPIACGKIEQATR